MEFMYLSRRPPPQLRRYAESVWYARGWIDYPRERIAPTGSTVAVVVLGAPIREVPDDGRGVPYVADRGFLLGPHDRPVVNEPTGETHCVGVVTSALGCRAVFGVDPAPLRGRVVDLDVVWPRAVALRRTLLGLADAEASIEAVCAALVEGLGPERQGITRIAAAVQALEDDPCRSIADLAARLGVSHGFLDREFTAIVGLSPRSLSRILRLRMLLAGLDVYGPVDWTALAVRLGWFDQSHLIRDFKRHTGVTPSQYVAAQRGEFTPDQAEPGFVPER